MNKSISTNQLAYSVSAFILASSLLASNLYQFAKNDSWVSVLMGFAASLLIVSIYIALSRRYPGMGLFDINNAVLGKIAGKAVSALYVFFFFELAMFNTRDLGDFIKSSVLRQTPLMLVIIIFLILCAWAVRKGPVNMTRYGFLATAVSVGATIAVTLFLVDKFELRHLLPAFKLPVRNYLIGAHIVAMLPFCEILAFMTLIPSMNRPYGFGHAMRKGIIIAAVMMLVVVLRDTIVLGKFISVFTMPSYYSARYIDIGDILTRVEIVYAIVLIGLLFFKVSIAYYAAVSGVAHIFGIDSNRPFIYIIGALICIYASACFTSMAEHIKWNMTAASTSSTFFIILLPLLTLLVSVVRESISKSENASKTQ